MNKSTLSRPLRVAAVLLALSVVYACASSNSTDTNGADANTTSSKSADALRLASLIDSSWERVMKDNPTFASSMGDLRYNSRWPDLSLTKKDAWHQQNVAELEQLQTINADRLSDSERLNYQLFKHEYEKTINNHQYRRYLVPLNQRGGIQSANEITSRIQFKNAQHLQDWVARLNSFDTYMDQTITLMRTGIKERIVHPKIIMERLPAQVDGQITSTAKESSFYVPFKTKPSDVSQSEFDQLSFEAEKAIATKVIPAYKKLANFIRSEYLPAARDSVGIWDSPNGKAYYEQRVKDFTTTDLTPDEVHAIGLSEVARIRKEMQKIIDQLEFEGSFAEFLTFLRTDPQFYHTNKEDLLEDYRATSKRIDPELVKLFSDLPSMPYGVIPIPDAIAPDTTTAYYSSPAADGSRAGYYYVNLYRPEVRPKYEIEVLTVHEAMPGHHLQIALAQELGDLPNFRRFGGYTAFVEGWGLYSESLGDELGLYKDPYSKFGQLTYEMWRAVRLVVDTGMHYKKWSRQQAIDFFTANAAKAEYDIVNEIDRYIAWPGQALAYKIGELKIKELRRKSEQTLGEKFDIRAFHKVVLGSGAVPLYELEKNVDAWINSH